MRVEASSMLMISSATSSFRSSMQRPRDQQPLQLAAAQLVGVLAEHGRRLEADRLERRAQPGVPLVVAQVGQERPPNQLEHAVGLEDRVVGAERILEDTLDLGVVACAGRGRQALRYRVRRR